MQKFFKSSKLGLHIVNEIFSSTNKVRKTACIVQMNRPSIHVLGSHDKKLTSSIGTATSIHSIWESSTFIQA